MYDGKKKYSYGERPLPSSGMMQASIIGIRKIVDEHTDTKQTKKKKHTETKLTQYSVYHKGARSN